MDYVPAAEIRVMVPAAGVRVVDGDTIAFGQEHVRVVGIDTPEKQALTR